MKPLVILLPIVLLASNPSVLVSHALLNSVLIHNPQRPLKTYKAFSSNRSTSRLYQSKEVLARDGDWAAYLDEETTGLIYYFNTVTGESVWEAPTASFPKISMNQRKKERMMLKRKEYFERQQQLEGERAFFSSQPSADNVMSEMNKKPTLFGGLLSNISVKDNSLTLRKESNRSDDVGITENIDSSELETLSVKDESPDETSNVQNKNGLLDWFFTRQLPPVVATPSNQDTNDKEEPPAVLSKVDPSLGEQSTVLRGDTVQFNFFNQFFLKSLEGMSEDQKSVTENEQASTDGGSSSSSTLNLSDFKQSTRETSNDSVTDTIPRSTSSKTSFIPDGINFFKKSKNAMDRNSGVETSSTQSFTEKTELRIEMISRVLPHPDKISWGGEDAAFCSGRCFGVFDGVSGADKEEGKPLYSVILANQLKESLGTRGGLSISQLKSELMDASLFADTCATGATTALVASIGADGFLRAINLGDSVLMVIRDDKILVKSKERIHYFDCPYQLSNNSPDRPRDATSLQVELLPGDIIVSGSDGIFDNLTESTVRKIVVSSYTSSTSINGATPSKVSLSLIAKKIVDESRVVSLDPKAQTPYAQMAMQNRYPDYESGFGGKVDDISCIVARCI